MANNNKKILNSILSTVFIFVMVFSSFASLPVEVFADDVGTNWTDEVSPLDEAVVDTQDTAVEEVVENNSSTEETTSQEIFNLDATTSSVDSSLTTEGNVDTQSTNTGVANQIVQTSSVSIEKVVKNVTDGSDYLEQVEADFGETVEFKLVVTNTGSTNLTDLYVADVLPVNLVFISESLSVPEPIYGGDLFSSDGLNVHDLSPSGSMVITFRAKVETADKFVVGETILTNSATAKETGGTPASPDTNTATVRVVKNNPSIPPSTNQCTTVVVSDTTNQVVGGGSAVATYSSHPYWTASIPGATWIWKTLFVETPLQDEFQTFTKNFNVIATSTVDLAYLVVAADNSYTVSINGTQFGIDNTETNYFDENKDTYNVAPFLKNGSNTISFTIKNWALPNSTAQTNPAGLLYKLTIKTHDANCDGTVTPPTNTPPEITLIGNNPLNIFIGSTFTDPGATATDAQDGNLTPNIIVSGTVSTSTLGTSTLTYSVYDSGGLGATTTRDVVVVATTTPPVVKPQCSDGLDNDGDNKIDSLDPGCHSDGNVENDSSFDPNDDSEVDVPSNPPSGGGGGSSSGGGGGGGSSSGGRRRDVSNLFSSGGEILGASSCSYLRDYLRIDWANDKVEVLKLQSFLNIYNGANLSLSGVFDQNTLVAVNNFQNRYESDILTPWGHDAPTGFVYILTKKKINEIYCNTTYPLTSEQAKEISDFRNFLESLKTNNSGASYDASGIGGDLEGAIKGVVVIDQNGEVVDSVSSTSTGSLVRNDSFSSSILRNAAVSIFAVPDSSLDLLRCLIAFLIILLVAYIVSGILTNGRKERRIVFLILSIIAIIISILINFYCVVAPLLVAVIISALLILLDRNNNGDIQKTEVLEVETKEDSVVEVNKNEAPENLPIKEDTSSVIEMPGEIVVENDEEEVLEPIEESEETKN